MGVAGGGGLAGREGADIEGHVDGGVAQCAVGVGGRIDEGPGVGDKHAVAGGGDGSGVDGTKAHVAIAIAGGDESAAVIDIDIVVG